MQRRSLLKWSLLGGAALSARALPVFAQTNGPVVKTSAGRVQGQIDHGVNIFKGIPYGASTAGANRFMPPRKPMPWSEVLEAFDYGPRALQGSGESKATAPEENPRLQALSKEGEQLSQGLFYSAPRKQSEDCLVLNVWSPGVGDGKKRPVLFWLHGGGFIGGSGDWGWSDGASLARQHDVVVVSINHRLNIFGFLYLAEFGGPKYADSGNVGMFDTVAALEWVRGNIAAFGGDPNNVTIFGQSGGGAKVNTLMAMPAARGLFHKAFNMSGPSTKMLTTDEAAKATLAVMDILKIDRKHIDELQRVPANDLLRAASKASKEIGSTDWRAGQIFHGIDAPVVDGRSLPRHPFYPDAPGISADVPLLLGNTGEEDQSRALRTAALSDGPFDDAALRANLKQMALTDSQIDGLIRGYRATRPKADAVDVLTDIVSDLEFRRDAVVMAQRKAALGRAPAYMYLFTWKTAAFNGKYQANHSSDIPFFFDNLKNASGLVGKPADPQAQALAHNMSRALAAFARTGNPNHAGLPQWLPYTEADRKTMIFDSACKAVSDPRHADRIALEALNLPS
jgi:para-nitrobenzyl esterase